MRLLATFLLLGLISGIDAPAAAQTSERTLYVSVLDKNGAPVTGLPADRFRVTEDGQTREVLRATRTTDRLDLAIVIDNSAAAQPIIQDLRRALTPFVTRLAKEGHSLALIGLADRPTVLQDYTSNASQLDKAVNRIFSQPGAGTVFQDTISDVARGLMKREAPRRAILVITTEETDFSNVPYQRTLELLKESGAALHALVLTDRGGGALRSQEARDRALVIDQGTRDTGGRREELLSSMALTEALPRLAAEIEQQYEVVYARPAALIPPKDIDVRVEGDGITARATPARTEEGGS